MARKLWKQSFTLRNTFCGEMSFRVYHIVVHLHLRLNCLSSTICEGDMTLSAGDFTAVIHLTRARLTALTFYLKFFPCVGCFVVCIPSWVSPHSPLHPNSSLHWPLLVRINFFLVLHIVLCEPVTKESFSL